MKPLPFAACALLSFALAQGVFGSANFLEPFDSASGDLAAYLLQGRDGAWNGQIANGAYWLSNDEDALAVEYVYLTALPGLAAPLSAAEVSVDVSGDFADADTSQAGLIFNVDPETRFYYAFMLKGGGAVSLVLRDGAGFRELASTTSDALRDGVNRLTVTPGGALLRFLVNGTEVMSIESPSLPPGGVGLIAAGTGRFAFDNFAVGTAKPKPAKTAP